MRTPKFFCIGALLILSSWSVTNAHAATCGSSGGVVTYPAGAGTSCSWEPSTYSVTIYKMGLCTSAPTAPTPTAAANLASCTTVYDNPSGATVSVSSSGAPVALPGGIAAFPPAGTYGYGYAIVSNTIGISTSVTFSSSLSGQVSGSGSVCWTVSLSHNIFDGSNSTSSCGATVGTVGTINLRVDTFDLGSLTYTQTLSVLGTNDLSVYILEPSGVNFANGTARSGASNRILGLQTFPTPVTVPAEPVSFDMAFKSSTGLTIINPSGTGTVKFSGGPFAMKLTVK